MTTVSLDWNAGPICRRSYGRKIEEYIADFCLIARRMLDDEHYDVFRYYFLLGGDCTIVSTRLNMDKGNFFHRVYRVEEILGRAFQEMEPYCLYPVDWYFIGHSGIPIKPYTPKKPAKHNPRRPPARAEADSLLQKIA